MKKTLVVLMAVMLLVSSLVFTGCDTGEPIPSYDIVQQDDIYKWIDENDKYASNGYDIKDMVSVDEYGRVTLSVGDKKEEKSVGMFYHVSQGFHRGSMRDIYDVSKIIAEYGTDKVFKEKSRISPNNMEHFWGEPLYGYYDSRDPYVIKKQLELFIAAGVDYLVLDVTNGFIYSDATRTLMENICALRADGWAAPQVVFYAHSQNNNTVRDIYKDFYNGHEEYRDAWYMKNGKPVIIAYSESEKDKAEARTRGVSEEDLKKPMYADLSQEILDFFHFVEPRWPNDRMSHLIKEPIYDKVNEEGHYYGYSWIEWKQPLPRRDTSLGTYMNVAVASHPNIPFSFSITRGVRNWGRNYNILEGHEVENGEYTGTYYQCCWDEAFEKDPDTLMLVLWNGWTALKQLWDGEYMMCDTCDFNYSLSIEPANGYYKDAYVLQTSQNTRKYSYSEGVRTHAANKIDINGTIAQWYNVDAVYRQIGKETYGRDYYSADGKRYHYQLDAAKNNIQEIRTVHDNDNVYMMIRCGNDITAQEGSNWMNVFITAGSPEQKGWNGYEYVINRKGINNGKAVIEKLNSDYSGSDAGEAEVVVRGSFMFLKIPRKAIGMTKEVKSFYFKVSDSVEKPEDILSYYTTGSVLPVGRYSYSYTAK